MANELRLNEVKESVSSLEATQSNQPIAVTVQLPPAAQTHWTAYATAVATPAVAVVAAIIAGTIAYRNWRTAQNKLKLDLFDRRMKVYENIRDTLRNVMLNEELTTQTFVECVDTIHEAEWLFNSEIHRFLVWSVLDKLQYLKTKLAQIEAAKEQVLNQQGEDAHEAYLTRVRLEREFEEDAVRLYRTTSEVRSKLAPFLTLQH
ncbi:hypothetical protein ACSFBX_22250 [Variovorax sp. RB2P76]|uniref:hypothetical protein n=1 Tax=Variovorax sp. RB2P76 TaxID=3443736 RepID=UPI003F44BF15